jgi:hypothetical protein
VQYAREVAAVWFDQPLDDVEVNLVVEGAADEIAAARNKRDAEVSGEMRGLGRNSMVRPFP